MHDVVLVIRRADLVCVRMCACVCVRVCVCVYSRCLPPPRVCGLSRRVGAALCDRGVGDLRLVCRGSLHVNNMRGAPANPTSVAPPPVPSPGGRGRGGGGGETGDVSIM